MPLCLCALPKWIPKIAPKVAQKWSQNWSQNGTVVSSVFRPILGPFWGPKKVRPWTLFFKVFRGGCSGPILAPSWPHLGAILAPSWPILAPSWRHLRLVLDHLGPSQGHLEPSWAHLLPQEEESWLSASSSSGGPSGLLWPLPLWPRGPDGPVWTRVVACMALKALMALIVPYCPSGS